MDHMEFTRNFKQLDKGDVGIAGGKGASLGEMTQAGIPVPSGFVVLSEAFEKFLKETDLHSEIDSILHKVDHKKIHTVENASEEIQKAAQSAKDTTMRNARAVTSESGATHVSPPGKSINDMTTDELEEHIKKTYGVEERW